MIVTLHNWCGSEVANTAADGLGKRLTSVLRTAAADTEQDLKEIWGMYTGLF